MSFFDGLFQIAYVTSDMEQARRLMRERFGVDNMHLTRGVEHSPTTRADIALAWTGRLMFELIEPHGDGSSVYEQLPISKGEIMRLHHLGHLIEDGAALDALREHLAETGQAIFAEHVRSRFHVLYVDTRKTLGHFTEHILCTAEGREFLESLPRN